MSRSTPYLRQNPNGIFYIHWTEDRVGQRRTTGTKDIKEARQILAKFILLAEEAPKKPSGAMLTVEEVWQVYKEKHVDKKVAGVYNAELAWRQMQPFFGARPVSFVTQDSVDEYVEKRAAGKLGRKVKPQTVAKELSYLMAALKFCADPKRKVIDPTLVQKVDLPEPGDPRDRWLTKTEIQKLLDAAARLRRGSRLSRAERFIWLALETAGRAEALLDLTWDRVDFETNVIHLDVPGRKKTKKGRSTVPISTALRPILERAYDERQGELVLDNKAKVWSMIQLVAIEAGFGGKRPKVLRSEKPKATGISPHVLRHTAATHMARRGVPLWIIAKILGNSIRMVERVYAKHAPDDLRDAINMISNGQLEAAE